MIYWIWLSSLYGIGHKIQHALLSHFKSPDAIYSANLSELSKVSGIGAKKAAYIYSFKDLQYAENTWKECRNNGISIITLNHQSYPESLIADYSMPVMLYYTGEIKMGLMGICVTGNERCSSETRTHTINLTSKLVSKGYPLINGFSKGVEGYALTSAIKSGGFPIVVLPHGLNLCYPTEYKSLLKEAKQKGLVLSEYPPGTKPSPYTIIQKNRIVEKLSDKILVMDAYENSNASKIAFRMLMSHKPTYVRCNPSFKEFNGCQILYQKGATRF